MEWCINSLGSVPASSRCLVNLGCIRILGMWCILPLEMVQYFMGSMSILDRGSHCSKGALAYCHFLCIVGSTNEEFPIFVADTTNGHNDQHTSRHPVATHLLRCLFLICAKYSISLSAEHLPGLLNTVVDALSRANELAFHQATPSAQTQPCTIPADLLAVLIHRCLNYFSDELSKAFQLCL